MPSSGRDARKEVALVEIFRQRLLVEGYYSGRSFH